MNTEPIHVRYTAADTTQCVISCLSVMHVLLSVRVFVKVMVTG